TEDGVRTVALRGVAAAHRIDHAEGTCPASARARECGADRAAGASDGAAARGVLVDRAGPQHRAGRRGTRGLGRTVPRGDVRCDPANPVHLPVMASPPGAVVA